MNRISIAGLAVITAALAASVSPAVEHWSVDLQGAGSSDFGQEDPPVLMSGPDPVFGLGNVWNAFDVAGHALPPAIDPSLNLLDSGGIVSPVSFNLVGNAAGFSNPPGGHALFKDYLFANAGNASPSYTWSITGLTPGAAYDMINYGGVGRNAAITVDLDGDGFLVGDPPQLAPIGGGSIVRNITANPAGTIIGEMAQGTVAEGNWGGFQLLRSDPTPVVGTLWSVDMHGAGNTLYGQLDPPAMMTGIEPNYGFGDVWNSFEVPAHDLPAVVDPSRALDDSLGNATPVSFGITGNVAGWGGQNNNQPLIQDYVFCNAGNSDPSFTWEITGLTPGGAYEMFAYGGIARDVTLTVDLDGDGDLFDEFGSLVPGGGHLFAGITADAAGTIIGSMAQGSVAEGNWGGFQLRDMNPVSGEDILFWDGQGDALWGALYDPPPAPPYSHWVDADYQPVTTIPTADTITTVRVDTVTVAQPQEAKSLEVVSGGLSLAGNADAGLAASLSIVQGAGFADGTSLALGQNAVLTAGGPVDFGANAVLDLAAAAALDAHGDMGIGPGSTIGLGAAARLATEGDLDVAPGAAITWGAAAAVEAGGTVNVAPGITVAMGADATLTAGAGGRIQAISTSGNATIDTGGRMDLDTLSDAGVADTTLVKHGDGNLVIAHDGVSAVATTAFQIDAGTLSVSGPSPLGQAASLKLGGGTFSVRNPVVKAAVPAVATAGLIEDLDADAGVTSDAAGVSLWANQAPSGGDDVAQTDDNLKPWLNVAALNGHDTITLAEDAAGAGDRMFGDDRDAFNGLIDGSGNTWFVVTRVGDQTDINLNRFFGTLTEGDYSPGWTGICPGVNIDEVPNSVTRAGGYDHAWGPGPLADGQFHVVGGRLAAGFGPANVRSELMIDATAPAGITMATVNPGINSDLLSIGVERLTGGEDYVGDIARILIYDRPLTNRELAETGLALQELYALGNSFGSYVSMEPIEMGDTSVTVSADSAIRATTEFYANFGRLTMEAGVLSTFGAPDGIHFAGTTVAAAATAVGFDPRTETQLGVIDVESAAVTISKVGSGDMVMTSANVGSGFAGATFSAEGGRLIGLHGSNPFDTAALQIAGGELVLSSTGGDVLFDNRTTVTESGTLTAAVAGGGVPGPLTVTLGSDTNGLSIDAGKMLTMRTADEYTLEVAGSLSGDGGLAIAEGNVSLSGTASLVGSITVSGGTVSTAGQNLGVSDRLKLPGTTVSVEPGGTFHVGGADLANDAVDRLITLSGGEVRISSGVSAPPDPIAYWPFDETTGATVLPDASSSADNYDGTIVGGPAFVPGVVGAAMQFDGVDDYVDLPDGFDDFTGGFSAAVWAQSAALNNWARFVDFSNGPGADNVLFTQLAATAGVRFEVRTGVGVGDPLIEDASDVNNLDTWQHFVATLDDAGNAVIYADGQPVATGVMWMPRNVVRRVNYIGESPWGGDDFFMGLMDELYVYDRALTADEVAQLYGGGDGPQPAAINLPQTNFAVAAGGSTLLLQSNQDAVLGDLTTEPGVTLTVTGAPSTSFNDVATGHGTTIQGAISIRGTISPGGSAGLLSLVGNLEFGEEAVYDCEIGQWDSTNLPDPWNPVPAGGPVNDKIHMTAGDALLGGSLELTAVDKLHPPVEAPGQPGVMVEWYGDQDRVIASAGGENSIRFQFDAAPEAQPEVYDLPGTGNWSQGHLGHGAFLTRHSDDDPAVHPGITYGSNATKVHVFQAADGDTNGDRMLDSLDIQAILSANSFPDVQPADWPQGDFTGDGWCNGLDIQAILATGLYPFLPGPYAAVEPGDPADPGDRVVDLLLYAKDFAGSEEFPPGEAGTLVLRTDRVTVNGYVIRSLEGIITGGPAENLGWFEEDTDHQISGNMGFTLTSGHLLGDVIGDDFTGLDPDYYLADLTFTYTIEGTPGTFLGTLIVIPEPGTAAMLLAGAMGLLCLSMRRRRPKA